MRIHQLLRAIASVLLVVSLAACATTARQERGIELDGLADDDDTLVFGEDAPLADGEPLETPELEGEPADGTSLPGDAASTGSAPADGSPAPPPATGADTQDPATPQPTAGSQPRAVPTGKGVTDTEIFVGFEVSEGITELFEAVGYDSGGPPPDEPEVVRAVVRWVNARGGIAGREVVPVIHGTNVARGTLAAQAQEACATFTEDNEVFAVGNMPLAGTEMLAACLAQRQTPLLAHNSFPYGQRHHRQWAGYLYQPGKMSGERGWSITVDGLAAQGFFRDAVIGLISYDHPHFRYLAEDVIKPRLARHGHEVESEVHASPINTASDAGRLSTEMSNAILRFRQAGVTHVLFNDYEGAFGFFFMPMAESQGYRPQYGLASFNNMTQLSKQAPAAQMRNALGVSWQPAVDTFRPHYPDDHPTFNQCMQIVREAGLDQGYVSPAYWTHPICDTVLFLEHTLERAPELTPAGLRHTVERLGTDWRSAQAFTTRFGPGRTDGADSWRLARYNDDCECMVFTGPAQRAP